MKQSLSVVLAIIISVLIFSTTALSTSFSYENQMVSIERKMKIEGKERFYNHTITTEGKGIKIFDDDGHEYVFTAGHVVSRNLDNYYRSIARVDSSPLVVKSLKIEGQRYKVTAINETDDLALLEPITAQKHGVPKKIWKFLIDPIAREGTKLTAIVVSKTDCSGVTCKKIQTLAGVLKKPVSVVKEYIPGSKHERILLETTLPSVSGLSGTPVFDEHEQLAGIISMSGIQNQALIVPAEKLRLMFTEVVLRDKLSNFQLIQPALAQR